MRESLVIHGHVPAALLLWGLVIIASGCKADDQAKMYIPGGNTLAAGAYFPFRFEDACATDPKFSICSSEGVVSIESFDTKPSGVVSLVEQKSLPESLQLTTDEYLIHALRPGKATIRMRARFDDDSVREAKLPVVVEE